MSKQLKKTSINLEKNIMDKVKTGAVRMKPRWYFIFGSLALSAGLAGIATVLIFVNNLVFFLLRQHGPMGQWRLQQILDSFTWWLPILALIGIFLGIKLLQKYDFSYKKNFKLVIGGLLISIILASALIDYLGFNEIWSKRRPMRQFYPKWQQAEQGNLELPAGRGRMRRQ